MWSISNGRTNAQQALAKYRQQRATVILMIFHRLVIEFTMKLRNARFHGGDLAECEDHLVRNVSLYIC